MKNVSKVLSALLVLVMVIGMFAMTATAAAGDTANLVKDVSTLANGDKVVILSIDGKNAMGALSGNYYSRLTLSSPAAGGSVNVTAEMEELTIVVNSDNSYSFAKENNKHLLSGDGSNNHLKEANAGSNHTKWTISIAANGDATITSTTAKKDGTARQLQYNSNGGQERFSTYTGTQNKVRLYKIGAAPAPVPATGISIDATAKVMTGFSTTLTATVTPSNSTDAITWASSNPAVATVEDGKIVGVKAGTATITVTAGTKSDTCVVTVADNAWTIVNAPVTGPFKLGLAQYAAGKMGYFNGSTDNADYRLAITENADDAVDMYLEAVAGGYHLYFLDAANDNAKTYIEIYEYDNNGTMKGSLKLTTTTPASAYTYNEAVKTLVATFGSNSYYMGSYSNFTNISNSKTSYILESDGSAKAAVDSTQFPVRMYQMKVASVELSNTTANVAVGGKVTLTATVNPSNASNPAVTWTSSDATIASVSNGVVTANKVGTATITATAEGKTATCTITVVPETIPAEKVELDKTTAELVAGKELNLTGVVTPATSTDNIVWTSSDETIAKVVDGKVTALKAGTVTITATAGTKSATCTITIAAAPTNVPTTGDISLVAPIAALLASAMGTVALVGKKKEI